MFRVARFASGLTQSPLQGPLHAQKKTANVLRNGTCATPEENRNVTGRAPEDVEPHGDEGGVCRPPADRFLQKTRFVWHEPRHRKKTPAHGKEPEGAHRKSEL